jgi:tetratricopeptide (TPR) repeat protein
MNICAFTKRITLLLVLAMMLIPAMSTQSFASGSDEKSPEEKAAENVRKATEKYNNGVKHMKKARLYDEQGDSLFAFNYRATSEDKAKKEYVKAVDDFEDAASLDPTMIAAYNNLGFCLRKLDKLDESLAAYDRVLAIDSLYPLAREYRGELFLAMDKPDSAQAELAVLRSIESPYADTLSLSIKLYQLNRVADQMKKAKEEH